MNEWIKLEKPRWYSGQDLITNWEIKGFELLDLMKNGLQAYTSTGKKVVDSDPLPKAKRDSLEKIEANQRAKENAGIYPNNSRRSDFERNLIVQRIYSAQRFEIIDPPKDCELMSFTLPNDDELANKVIAKVLLFQFKSTDTVRFDNEYNQINPLPAKDTHNDISDADAFSHNNSMNSDEPRQSENVPGKETAQQEGNREETFVKSVGPEALKLYNAIKSGGFKGLDIEIKLQDRAKNELKVHPTSYSHIKNRHLKKKLFDLNIGQEKRDFIGHLLQIIAKEHGIKKISYQKLYKIYTLIYSNRK